jgi:ATP-dependent DNA helicase RecG
LSSFASTSDGFKVAELDLRLRGPGEFFGIRQHGIPNFRFADIVEHSDLLVMARRDAMELLSEDPELSEHQRLAEEIERRFGQELTLVEVG